MESVKQISSDYVTCNFVFHWDILSNRLQKSNFTAEILSFSFLKIPCPQIKLYKTFLYKYYLVFFVIILSNNIKVQLSVELVLCPKLNLFCISRSYLPFPLDYTEQLRCLVISVTQTCSHPSTHVAKKQVSVALML
jgi:hypothetical protein